MTREGCKISDRNALVSLFVLVAVAVVALLTVPSAAVAQDVCDEGANFSYDPDYPEEEERTTFIADARGTSTVRQPKTFEWGYGDGDTDVGSMVSHDFDDWGTYNVTLEVTTTVDGNETTETCTKSVIVKREGGNLEPNANFSYTPSDPMVNEPVRLDASDSYDRDGFIERYEWVVDGTRLEKTGRVITHTFERSKSNYRVTLRVVDDTSGTDIQRKTLAVAPERDMVVETSTETVRNTTRINTSVTDARPNATVSVNPSQVSDEVGVESLRITTREWGDFDVNVTVTRTGNGYPGFTVANATRLSYVNVEDTASDGQIGNVSLRFRVGSELLDSMNVESDNVALYRYGDGWTELQTSLVSEDDDGYVYVSNFTGLSVFAVGAETTKFNLSSGSVTPSRVNVSESVTATVEVSNVGSANGTAVLELIVDGESVGSKRVSVPANTTREVSFEHSFDETGSYSLRVNEATVGNVTVVGSDDGGDNVTPTEPDDNVSGNRTPDDEEQPGFTALVTLVSLVAVCLALWAGRRR